MTLYMIELTVRDIALSSSWYQSCLGFTIERDDMANGFILLRGIGGGRLAIKHGLPQVGGVKLHFEVSNLDSELSRLADLGVTPVSPLITSPEGYRRAIVSDPDGYLVVLFEWQQVNVY